MAKQLNKNIILILGLFLLLTIPVFAIPAFNSVTTLDADSVYGSNDATIKLSADMDSSAYNVTGDFSNVEGLAPELYAANVNASATWDIDKKYSGDASVLLNLSNIDSNTDARFIQNAPSIKLKDIWNITYTFYVDSSANGIIGDCWFEELYRIDCTDVVPTEGYAAPYLGFELDTDSNGAADTLVIEHKFAVNKTPGSWYLRNITNSSYFHSAGAGELGGGNTTNPVELKTIKDIPTLGDANVLKINLYFGGWNLTQISLSAPIKTYVDDLAINNVLLPEPYVLGKSNGDGTYNLTYAINTKVDDGNYNIDLLSVDPLDQSSTATTYQVAIDSVKPSLNDSSLRQDYNGYFSPNGDGIYDAIDIVMNSSELVDWGQTKIYNSTNDQIKTFNGVNSVTSNIETWTGGFTGTVPPYVPDGVYTINTTITDQADNVNTTYATTIYVDNTAPTTSDSGTDTSWHSSDVTITLSCNDGTGSGCDKTAYCIDQAGTCTPNIVYSAPFAVSTDGINYARFRSNDSVVNLESVKSATNTVKIDKTGPAVGSITPLTTNEDVATSFQATYSDALSGPASCSLYVGSLNNGSMSLITGTANRTVIFSEPGTYSLYANCSDNLGNWDNGSITAVTIYDITNPVISGVTGNTNAVTSQGTKAISAAVTDNVAVDQKLLYYKPIGGAWQSMDISSGSANVPVANGAVGDIYYYIWANDTSNNIAGDPSADGSSNYTITVADDNNPAYQWVSNPSSGTTGESVLINITGSDNVAPTSANVTIDGTEYVMSKIGNNFNYTIAVPHSLSSVIYNITVYDAAGNYNTTGTTTIIVTDNDLPLVTLNTPPAGWYNANTTVDATVTDNIAVSSVKYTIGSNVISMTNYAGNNWNATLDVSSVADGNYTIIINATDSSGNSNTTVNVSDVAIDDTIPLISNLVSGDSDNKARDSDMLNFTVDASDSNLNNVTLNGTLMTRNGSSDIYYLYTNASDLGCNADGDCTLTATVYDHAGNYNLTSYNLFIDDVAPVISNEVFATLQGSSIAYNSDLVYLNATVEEALTNIDSVWISGNWTGSWANTSLTNVGNGKYSHIVGAEDLQNGEVIGWRYYANDTVGNVREGNLNSFTVTNRNPVFSGTIVNLTFYEDGPEQTISLFNYFSDPDSPDDTLILAPTSHSNYQEASFGKWSVNQTSGIITIRPNANYNGTDEIIFNVTDKFWLYNESNTVKINVIGQNEPPTGVFPFSLITFEEDSYNDTIDLDDYFSDVDGTISSYTFTRVSSAENITVDIDATTHVANISAAVNTSGVGKIYFTAIDNEEGVGNSNVLTINVTPVNDAPSISGIPEINIKEDSGTNSSINLTQYTVDVETAPTDLVYYVTYENVSKVDCGINTDGDRLDVTTVADWFGTAYCNITASDGLVNSTAFQLSIIVENINDAPVIVAISDQTATEDAPFSYQVTATDKDNNVVSGTDTLTYSLTTKPDGMGIHNSSGLIIWLPDNDDVGEAGHNVVVKLVDGKGGEDTESFKVTVFNTNDAPSAPTLTSPANGATIITDSVTLNWSASTDADGDTITYYIYHRNQSTNITNIGSTTNIEYTVSDLNHDNTYYWYVIAGDGTANSTASSTYSYIVSIHNPPTITDYNPTDLSPSVAEDSALEFNVTAEDVDADSMTITWKLDGKSVSATSGGEGCGPSGCTATSNYEYSPSFNDSGLHTVSVLVNDSTEMTDSMSWTVTVSNTNREPILASIGAKPVDEDSELEFIISASDDDIQFGDSITFSVNNTILTLTEIDGASAKITWTPENDDVGVHSVNISVTDSYGGQDSEVIDINVININDAPVITDYSPKYNPVMAGGESQEFNIIYEDVDAGDTATVTWTRDGTSIEGDSSAIVSGLDVGVYDITATVTDSASATDSYSWILTVSNVPVVKKYTGTIGNIPEDELGNATNVSVEEPTYGGINFGTNRLNLTGVVDIDNNVLIGPGVVGINTARYPQLNKPAHIIMKGLSFETEPVIYYTLGLGKAGNTVCPFELCTNIEWDDDTGILEFDVEHFSTYFVTTNNRPVANAGSDLLIRVMDGVVTLDGSASYDPDNDTLTYQWTQVSGLDVVLSDAAAASPTFIPEHDGTYVFELVVNDGTINSLPDNVTATVYGSVLSIERVSLSSDNKDEELKPGEELTVKVKVENNGAVDVEDIELKIWFENSDGSILEDDDGDDIEEEDEFDLDEDDKETITFEFTNMPVDVEDGDKYTVHITAEGKNKDNNSITYLDIDESETIEFVRERHELEIYRAVITPESIKCSGRVNLEVGVRNLGEKEEDVTLTISNSQLDINKKESFELTEDLDDEDSRNDVDYGFVIGEDVEAGLYPITVRADYSSKSETKVLNLEVQDCEKVVEKKEEVLVKKEPIKKDVVAKKEEIVKEPIMISFKDSPAYLILLANTFILLTGLVILLIGAAIVTKRR